MIDAALWYTKQGFPVFPCKPRGKEPLTEHGFKDATIDRDCVEAWWAEWPDANIAMPTGAVSDLLFLDCDPRNGGPRDRDELIERFGPVPDTAEAITGGGGRHFAFQHPGVPLRKALAPGLVGAESGGVHLYGGTSSGKSTALMVGGSVCGGGGQTGFVQTWRATINGLEAVAEAHNDGTLFLDELAQADPREAAETAYLLSNGQGKSRMTRSMGARRKLTWTLLFVSAGELTLAEHAAAAGKKTRGGVEVRLLNVAADAGRSMGIFEDLQGHGSPDAFSRALKEAARHYYGSPVREFIRRVGDSRAEIESSVRGAGEAFTRRFVPAHGTGEVKRAADRFALIGAAGELATEYGLTGWREGEAIDTAKRCFEEWVEERGTLGASDIEVAVRQVRGFLEAHGTSRFQLLRVGHGDEEAQIIRDRAGFRRFSSEEDNETEYLILPETFRNEVCKGFSYQAVATELDRRKLLIRELPHLTIKRNLPEVGSVRVYCVRAAISGGDEC